MAGKTRARKLKSGKKLEEAIVKSAPPLKTEKKQPPAVKSPETLKTEKKQPPAIKSAEPPKSEKKAKQPIVEKEEFMKTGIAGLDSLFKEGIPTNSSVLIAGGTGSGKTLLTLQILCNAAREGKKCFYMSFEESEERLDNHMRKFGWDLGDKKGNLLLQRFNLFDITRSIDAMLAKQSGDLLIEVEPVILPKGFKPDIIVVDSLTAIASAFYGRGETYRLYINQLFRFFEDQKITTFLISETNQDPKIYSTSGVEEFLADGVIVLYNIRSGNVREHGLEVLKMRGTEHERKIVAMQIISGKGIEIFPDQEVFSVE